MNTRQIKFRAWNKEKYKMYKCVSVNLNQSCCVDITIDKVEAEEYCRAKNIILMQFTGLLDKNGKEIYEGDIVNLEDSQYKALPNGNYKVYWSNSGFMPFRSFGYIVENSEIIGNIYENPELFSSPSDTK